MSDEAVMFEPQAPDVDIVVGEDAAAEEPDFMADLESIYKVADEKGMKKKDIENLTDDQVKELLVKEETPETAESETVETTPEAEPKEPAKETPEDAANYKERYDNLMKLKNKHDIELGELRQIQTKYKGFFDALEDKSFQNYVLSYFGQPQAQPRQPQQAVKQPEIDPEDPDYFDQRVNKIIEDREIQKTAQQRMGEQQNKIKSFFSGQKQSAEKLIAEGKDPNTVAAAMQKFWEKFNTGDIADMAYLYANHENLITDAKKQAAEDAIRQLKNVKDTNPKRTAGAETKGKEHAATPASLRDIETQGEWERYVLSLTPNSPQWEEAMIEGIKRGYS